MLSCLGRLQRTNLKDGTNANWCMVCNFKLIIYIFFHVGKIGVSIFLVMCHGSRVISFQLERYIWSIDFYFVFQMQLCLLYNSCDKCLLCFPPQPACNIWLCFSNNHFFLFLFSVLKISFNGYDYSQYFLMCCLYLYQICSDNVLLWILPAVQKYAYYKSLISLAKHCFESICSKIYILQKYVLSHQIHI